MVDDPSLAQKKADVLRDNQRPVGQGVILEAPLYHVNRDVKLPEWVKCMKCGGPPIGYNWLKPVNEEPECRLLIHLGCIESGLSRQFENQVGGRGIWPS